MAQLMRRAALVQEAAAPGHDPGALAMSSETPAIAHHGISKLSVW